MKCIKCGADCMDGRFCPVCGTKQPIKDPQWKKINSARKAGKLNEKNKRIAAWIGIGLLLAGICFLLVSLLMQPTINLNKYMSVSVEGYDTVGVANCVFNESKFARDYGKKLAEKTGSKSGFLDNLFGGGSSDAEEATYAFLSECVSWTCSPDSSLSNGDNIVLNWTCDDQTAEDRYGYKLKYSDITQEVSGLKEGKAFDPFDGIEVVFEGISPQGTAYWSGEAKNEAGQGLDYSLDNSENLKNGDEVILSVAGDPNEIMQMCVENYGVIPSPLEKKYKVEGLASYIHSLDEISKDSLDAMVKQGEDVYLADHATSLGEDEEIEDISYIGSYLLTKKESASSTSDDENKLYLVYKIAMHNRYTSYSGQYYENTNPVYWYTEYRNVSVDPSGATEIDLTDYYTPGESFDVDSGIGGSWYYNGYPSVAELHKYVATGQGDVYEYSENIDESGAGKSQKKKKKDAASTEKKKETSDKSDGMIFPDSSKEVLSKDQIKALSDSDLNYAINEIYARNGYIFSTESLQKYYEKFDWYKGTADKDHFSESVFNDIEQENLTKLTKERASRQ